MNRIFIAIAGSCFAAALLSPSADAANKIVPLACKSPTSSSNPGGYPGPKITNDTGKAISKGKRIRWHKTTSGPGNSMGEITLSKKLADGDSIFGGDALYGSKCKAEVDKLRPDLWIKSATQQSPDMLWVKVATGKEWGVNNAKVRAEIFACNADVPSFTVETPGFTIKKGEDTSIGLPHDPPPGGLATAVLTVDPHHKYDEISEWNNTSTISNCPCGASKECGDGLPACGPGKKCDDGCCALIPPA